jgi:hypothetical protein
MYCSHCFYYKDSGKCTHCGYETCEEKGGDEYNLPFPVGILYFGTIASGGVGIFAVIASAIGLGTLAVVLGVIAGLIMFSVWCCMMQDSWVL